jgi:two-component system chemotaxis sensor kinase CheA
VRLAKVFDVLPHLLRNSIDHGIEPLEQRIGKDEVASIRLRVRAADRLLISVADDGRGINVGCVGRRAIELGAITEAQLATMASADRLNLIFVAGLSTAERASETSGRGIGMAAVQRAIEALGGTLSVTSDPGRGTEVQIAFARVCGGQSGDWQE